MQPEIEWDGHVEGKDDPNLHAELVRLSHWGDRPLSWLWKPLIPRRKVTLLVGEQEVGKSFFALDLAARLSRGEAIPPGGRFDEGPAASLLLAGDDELDDTIYPRLCEMGADLDRVFTLTTSGPRTLADGRPPITLADSVECLRHAARTIGDCRLFIIDPVTAFIEGMGINSQAGIRRLLDRLTMLAKVNEAAVLLISHTRKSTAGSLLQRTVGSLAFTIAARVVLTLIDDPFTLGRRLILPAKMNLRPLSRTPGRAFTIHDGLLRWELDPVTVRPDELQRLVARGLAASDLLLDVAERLRRLLADGPLPSLDVHKWADEQRIPRLLLFQAKASAGIHARRDGKNRRWYWQLPNHPTDTPRLSPPDPPPDSK